MLQPI